MSENSKSMPGDGKVMSGSTENPKGYPVDGKGNGVPFMSAIINRQKDLNDRLLYEIEDIEASLQRLYRSSDWSGSSLSEKLSEETPAMAVISNQLTGTEDLIGRLSSIKSLLRELVAD